MRHRVEAVAAMVVLTGFLLFNTPETTPVGALLVVGGAYALVVGRFVGPRATR
jgi:hypothetical protein